MGSGGRCLRERATCENSFATLECEFLARRRFTSRTETRMAIFYFIEGWHNSACRHSGIGYLSPIARDVKSAMQIETTYATNRLQNRGNLTARLSTRKHGPARKLSQYTDQKAGLGSVDR